MEDKDQTQKPPAQVIAPVGIPSTAKVGKDGKTQKPPAQVIAPVGIPSTAKVGKDGK